MNIQYFIVDSYYETNYYCTSVYVYIYVVCMWGEGVKDPHRGQKTVNLVF